MGGKYILLYSCLLLNIILCTAQEQTEQFTQTVVIQGVKFALLDDVPPTEHTLGCQQGTKYIFTDTNQTNWKIANPTNPIHRKAVGSLPWGTSCLGMEGGISLGTKTLNVCKQQNAFTQTDEYSESSFTVNDCDQRILLYYDSPTPINEAKFFYSTEGTIDKSEGAKVCSTVASTAEPNRFFAINCDIQANDVIFTKAENISSSFSVSLQAGFTFKISSKCPNCTLDAETPYYVVVTLHHDKGSESIYLSWSEAFSEYEDRSFTLIPPYKIQSISLNINFTTLQGAAFFKYFSILPIDNLLKNPSFHSNKFLQADNWQRLAAGYMPDIPRVDSDTTYPFGSILMSNSFAESVDTELNLNAASQIIEFEPNDQIRSFYIAGYSKASSVSGTMDDNYAIYCDFEYTDGSHLYGQTVQFSTGTHDWEYRDMVVETLKPLRSLNITLIFRGHTGAVWFDDVTVQIAYATPEDRVSNNEYVYNCTAGAFGDPFFSTFFGQLYSFQTPGDFFLVQSRNLNIQTRHQKLIGNFNGTLISAVGIQLIKNSVSHTISFQFPDGAWDKAMPLDYKNSVTIYHNGIVVDIDEDGLIIPSFGVVTKSSYSYYVPVVDQTNTTYSFNSDPSGYYYLIKFPEGEVIVDAHFLLNDKTGEVFAGYFRIFIHLSSSFCSSVDGLLGTTTALYYSHSVDKLNLQNATQDEINKLGNSWRLDPKQNVEVFFTPPNVQTYQPNFPPYPFSYNYTSEIEILRAQASCERQSLTSLSEICVQDVLLTGNQYISQDYHSAERHLRIVLEPLQLSGDVINTWYSNVISLSKNYGTLIIGSIFVLVAIAGIITIFRCKKTKKSTNSSHREMLINDEEGNYLE